MDHLILSCRPGFESECAAEMTERAGALGIYGYAKTAAGSGWVLFVTQHSQGASTLIEQLPFRELVFTRQWLASAGRVDDLPAHDRVGPLLHAARELPECGELHVDCPDSAATESLAVLCRKLTSPAAQALRKAGVLSAKRTRRLPRLHCYFVSGDAAYVGISHPRNSSRHEGGIPRLRFPAKAPSRSTLKLEEALLFFLSVKEREHRLQPGMSAVDLGAAPGGWTWQLVQRHLRVTAVDNGPMQPALMESGLVVHEREDGFRYVPTRPVDWMVCDMAAIPMQVAERMALWFAEGWCKQAIFNLKLPMKKRYQAVCDCRERIETRLNAAGVPFVLDFKQLYHDREEVTAYLRQPD
ncbi:23S rRNA (cytidine(2498)-2'-O)-methyltransferase RlmM [Motiliproteus sediminis]|uniref:23S rRNA (cytidine(2498)-2'-O)-methyltransferase RlmM n=1 Tax=Motiliproteus sediminis TaxID=1468178 RepID=UPI001AEFAA41|nr:23S rRNA (cytidine(2498)-2'-O)-methyltransferase RlmM [Motiliproteus sediminis]